MPDRHPIPSDHLSSLTTVTPPSNKRPAPLDETHWRAAAEEGLRLAAKQWQVPLDHITEIALSDTDAASYLFKVLYTDQHGQRRTAAVRMPRHTRYTSPLSMTSMLGPRQACHTP